MDVNQWEANTYLRPYVLLAPVTVPRSIVSSITAESTDRDGLHGALREPRNNFASHELHPRYSLRLFRRNAIKRDVNWLGDFRHVHACCIPVSAFPGTSAH